MNKQSDIEAIGGYFDLEVRRHGSYYHQDALQFQSARAAFRAVLQLVRPSKVWMPKYICDAMVSPLLDEGVEIGWYDIDGHFDVDESVRLSSRECLLYVNYFGVCRESIDRLCNRFNLDQLIMDYSQSFFDIPIRGVLATIYSPRKFFGVADGGVLITDLDITSPSETDAGTLGRMSHLLKRMCGTPESGYEDYQAAESSLRDTFPRCMSKLTSTLLRGLDYPDVRGRRAANFAFLHDKLVSINCFPRELSLAHDPLCYPLLIYKDGMRDHLRSKRIFIPTYWVDSVKRLGEGFCMEMVDHLLPLPIDQRYGEHDMGRIVDTISEKLS